MYEGGGDDGGSVRGGTRGKIKQRVRTVRVVPQITLGRNQTKNGPKKSSPGAEAYIKMERG